MILHCGLSLLLLLSASSYHVRSSMKLNLNFHKIDSNPAWISTFRRTALSSVLESSDISVAVENSDDDVDFSVIGEMGQEMMELIVEAATLKSASRQIMVPQSGMIKETDMSNLSGLSDISYIMTGLNCWKQALLNGHLPEFDDIEEGGSEAVWPDKLLSDELCAVCNNLELPFLTSRHPELIPSVLRGLLEVSINYSKRITERNKKIQEEDETTNKVEDENDPKFWEDNMYEEGLNGESEEMVETASEEVDFEGALASSLASQFASAWAPPLGGLSSLDDLYGPNHGLLSPGGQEDIGGGAGAGKGGFGLFDGVWQHTGWAQITEIQKQLKEMHELRDLIRSLGRRPAVNGTELRKTPPQRETARSAPLGVGRSSRSPLETSGVRYSDTIEGLLPSEMMLLAGLVGEGEENKEERENGERKRRLLFLAKRAEKLLGSYEITGWTEQLSLPRKKPWTRFQTLPTAPGGPIIVCLDTSWSMAGPRENLAKAVVLECSKQASKQHRACHILAFSGGGNIKDFEIPLGAGRKEGLLNLLNFLGNSFRGGTDICSPLIRGSELVEGNVEWGGADLLMVTDGELQNPPVPKDVMASLARMEKERGLEIHGLLIGRNTSAPLTAICTDWDGVNRVHTFLCKYDLFSVLKEANEADGVSAQSPFLDGAFPFDLEDDDEDDGPSKIDMMLRFKELSDQITDTFSSSLSTPSVRDGEGGGDGRAQAPHKSKYDSKKPKLKSNTRLYAITPHSAPTRTRHLRTRTVRRGDGGVSRVSPLQLSSSDTAVGVIDFDYLSFLKASQKLAVIAVERQEQKVAARLQALRNISIPITAEGVGQGGSESTPEVQQSDSGSRTGGGLGVKEEGEEGRHQSPYRNIITSALNTLGNGLVERDIEVKLLLLSVLCKEHVLLLGPPGTGKSELGRRLASMGGGGIFFERLLTKYSNPEELFGPLSLSALERDEYVRNTEGYLPTASVAFLDEIFKANSAILNSLLTILNERRFDNGRTRQSIPLLAVVAASNELPESEELDALYDRFLFRRLVSPVTDNAIKDLLTAVTTKDFSSPSSSSRSEEVITDSLTSSLFAAASSVQLSSEVVFLLRDIRAFMRDEMDPPVYCSDRRIVKAAAMLRTVAASQGKASASLLDCLLLQHVLWYHPDDQKVLRDWLLKRVVPEVGLFGLEYFVENVQKRVVGAYMNKFQDPGKMFNSETNLNNFLMNNENMREIMATIDGEKDREAGKEKRTDRDREKDRDRVKEGYGDKFVSSDPVIAGLFKELQSIKKVLVKKIVEFQFLARECRGAGKGGAGYDHLWLSDLETVNVRQNIAPRLDSAVKEIERLLVVVIGTGEVMGYSRGGDVEAVGVDQTVAVDGGDSDVEEGESASSRERYSASASSEGHEGREVSDLSKIDLIQELWSKYKSKGAPVSLSVNDSEDSRQGGGQGQGQGVGISDNPKSGSSKSSYKKSMKNKRNMADDYDS